MIYLDYNATTPVAQEVLDDMLPYFTEIYGNAASRTHLLGWDAKEGVDNARTQIADLIQVNPKEIIFTSGATESVNLALKGLFEEGKRLGKNHIITIKTEHKAVLDTCAYLEEHRGAQITYLDVDTQGNIDLESLVQAIREQTLLMSVMYVNNETGLIHPIEQISRICKKHKIFLFSDATQAIAKMEVHPKKLGIDLMAFSSHKIYGPKGVGALYIENGVQIQEQQNGGQHERKRRSGTLNVPAIVGFGKAVALAHNKFTDHAVTLMKQRDYLESSLLGLLKEVSVNGDIDSRMPHVSNLLFKNIIAEDLMLALSTHVALSSGSACNSASVLPSHVLKAMQFSDNDALSSIRFSLGRPTTDKDIDQVIDKVVEAVKRLRV